MDEVLKLLSVLTGDSRFEETQKSVNKEGGAVTMCEVLDRVEARGVIKASSLYTEQFEYIVDYASLYCRQAGMISHRIFQK